MNAVLSFRKWGVPTVVLVVAAILWICWTVSSSTPFGSCIYERKNLPTYQALHEDAAPVARFAARVRLHSECAVHVANLYQGSVSASATILVAIFAMTLWMSTHRLWQSAEAQRQANERAMEASGAQTRQSLAISEQAASAAVLAADGIREQRELMHGQQEIMSSQLEISLATQRAWVSAMVQVAGPLEAHKETISGSFTLELSNFGTLPAVLDRPRIAAFPWSTDPTTSQDGRVTSLINTYCAEPLLRQGVIFPRQAIREPIRIEIHKKDILSAKNTMNGFIPVLRGAIRYSYPASNRVHHTTFHVHVVRISDVAKPSLWHTIPTEDGAVTAPGTLLIYNRLAQTEAT